MARPHAVVIGLSEADRSELQRWARRRKTTQALALRSRIVLACAEPGVTNTAVASALGVSLLTVSKWRRRFARLGLAGLDDAPRSGAPRSILDEQVEAVVRTTLEAAPENATHWSSRMLAARLGLSQTAVSRIWRAFALAPHRTKGFKLSTDPHFVDKVRDIVGLYLHPPERALVLCVDEKPSIQARTDTAPAFPMRPGQLERHTHDYLRHGTTDLFAALDGQGRHRHRRGPPAAPQCGVSSLPADGRACYAGRVRAASGAGQRQHPQDAAHPALAAQAPQGAAALHANFRVLAQLGRVLVFCAHRAPTAARQIPLHPRAGSCHSQLRCCQQRNAEAVCLDQDRRPDPRIGRRIL